MTKHKLSHIAAYIAVFAAFFAAGCRENTIINTNITPAGDSIYTEGESVAISARSVYSHFITSQYVSGATLVKGIGNIYHDPEIGKTNISLFMQVAPKQSAGYVLPDTNKIDSIVLVLPYHGFVYGDTVATQEYTVYEITETFNKSDTFYDHYNRTYDPTPLGQTTINFEDLKDSVFVEGKNQVPHLRVKLNALAKGKLKNANYSSYADFFNSFKGLYIRASDLTNSKNIPYFRLTDDGAGTNYSKAGLVVYYRDGNDSAKTDLFAFNGDNCAQFNRVENNMTGSIAVSDTANYVYLQSRPGLSVEINTLNLKAQPNRLVAKAELIITEAVSANNQQRETYFPARSLYPYLGGNDVTLAVTTDATMAGLTFINGVAKQVVINGETVNQYIINVPREFQKALKEGREMSLRITGVTEGFYTGAFRLKAYKFNSVNHAFDIRLNVVYSRVQ